MNATKRNMMYEAIEGQRPYGSNKPAKYKSRNNMRCPELDMIGNHVEEQGSCKYCGNVRW